jgi:hypothetical protein
VKAETRWPAAIPTRVARIPKPAQISRFVIGGVRSRGPVGSLLGQDDPHE